jgi:hypothetical protein
MNTSPTHPQIIAIIKRVLPKASAAKRESIYSAMQGWSLVRGTTVKGTAQTGTYAVRKLVDAGKWTGQTNTIKHISTYDTATTPRSAFGMDIGKVCKVIRKTHPTCWVAVDWDAGTATPYHGRK